MADGTSVLGDGEFSVDKCRHSFKLILPHSCKQIAEHALSLGALSECNFNHIKMIDKQAFAMCNNLRSVESNSMMSIGERAFGGCEVLESVLVPIATRICTAAFENCSALKRADIRGITAEFLDTSQTEYIFKECYGLEQLIVSQEVYDNLNKYTYQLGVDYRSKDFSNLEILPASNIPIH